MTNVTIGITGANGFLGWHLRARLHAELNVTTRLADRSVFADSAALTEFARQSDVIVHFAGMNRGAEAEIEHMNVALAQALVDSLHNARHRPHVIYINSTHYDRDTAYGRSKRHAAALLGEWARATGARFTNLVLPGVYGEHGRPNYNSVVATFCHRLAGGETPTVLENREIELIHAQDVADRILVLARGGAGDGQVEVGGSKILVSDLLDRLRSMADHYVGRKLIPDVADRFDLSLFNTLRSYLFPAHYPVSLELRTDERGSLFEAVKTVHGGQCFLSTTKPGVTRGNHYHRAKIERFLVIHGDAVIRIRRLFAPDVAEFRVRGDRPAYIDMPTLHTHNITNVGTGELVTMFWAHEVFDPDRSDTYRETV